MFYSSFPNVSLLTVTAILKVGIISPIFQGGSWTWRRGVIYHVIQLAGGRVRTGIGHPDSSLFLGIITDSTSLQSFPELGT